MVKVSLPSNASSKRKQQTQALNASTNGGDASRVKAKTHTPNKGSQTALITRLLVSHCLKNPDAGRVAPISACV